MSSVTRESALAGSDRARRTYITMRPYNNDFFSYTTVNDDFNTTGVLGPVVGATSANCLEGRFLRETGRRIYPGANPGISTMMLSVFDVNNGLTGFIDPNSFAFTPQNTDRAYFIASPGYNPNPADAPLRDDQGPPVYTHGNIKADGTLYIGKSSEIVGRAQFNSNVFMQSTLSVSSIASFGSNVNILGSLSVGGGTPMTKITSGTIATLSNSLADNPQFTVQEVIISVPTAVVGNKIIVNMRNSIPNYVYLNSYVSGSNLALLQFMALRSGGSGVQDRPQLDWTLIQT
jgi:hypothetical protein